MMDTGAGGKKMVQGEARVQYGDDGDSDRSNDDRGGERIDQREYGVV